MDLVGIIVLVTYVTVAGASLGVVSALELNDKPAPGGLASERDFFAIVACLWPVALVFACTFLPMILLGRWAVLRIRSRRVPTAEVHRR